MNLITPDDADALCDYTNARPLSEWHEDIGNTLWWAFPVEEPPYVGTPIDDSWPGYHTHFTKLPIPNERQDKTQTS